MNDRNRNQGQDNPGTGAGSRQHEQQTEGDRQSGQMEQQGGAPGSPDDVTDSSSPAERRAGLGGSTPGGPGQGEQQTSGDAMQPGSDIRAGQQEQRQGGSYRAEGDRGVAFEPDQGNAITFDEDGQLESQLQQEESGGRQQQQQGGAARQPDEPGRDADDAGGRSEDR